MIDVFKVGVHIGMSTNSAPILATMLKELTGIHLAAGKVEKSLGAIRAAALGAGAVFAGWLVVKGLISATEHAEKLNHELVKLQIGMRLSDSQTAGEARRAFDITRRIPGTSVVDLVKQKRELAGTLGSMENAESVAELVAQGSAAVSRFVDKDTDLAKIAVRALEIRGQITKDHKVDPAAFAKEFDMMVRSIIASEGLLKPENLLQFIQQAGPAARNMSPEAMWGMAPAVMNALGSSKAGTALNSMFAQFVGHVVAGRRVAEAMEDAGMVTPGKWKVERGGKVRMDADAVPDQAGFMKNPFEWMHEKLEAMRGSGKDTEAIIQSIFQLGSRATSQRLISDIDANWAIIQAEKHRFDKTPSIPVIAKEQNEKDLSVNVKNLSAAWENFQAAIGGPGIPIVIGALQQISGAQNMMQKVAVEHPEVAKALFEFTAAIGSAFLLGPVFKLFHAAFDPLITQFSRLASLAPSMGGVGGALTSMADGISSFINAIKNIKFPDLPSWLGGGGGTPGASPNVPWSGKTYGPHGNSNSDGTSRYLPKGAQSWNTLPSDGNLFPPRDSPFKSAGPMKVTVVNSGDIGRSITGGIAEGASRPMSGPSYHDYRHDLPAPGFGSLA